MVGRRVSQSCPSGKMNFGQGRKREKDWGFVPFVVAPIFIIINVFSLGDAASARKAFLRQVMGREETSERKLGGLGRLLRK